jgi:hypothetical protein
VKRTVTCFRSDSRFACVAKPSTREVHYFADLHIRRHREFALSHTKLYQDPVIQEHPPLTPLIHCNFHFHFCEQISIYTFPFNVPSAVQVFTLHAALVRGNLSHSLFSNLDSSRYDKPSVALKPQTDYVDKTASLQYHV